MEPGIFLYLEYNKGLSDGSRQVQVQGRMVPREMERAGMPRPFRPGMQGNLRARPVRARDTGSKGSIIGG